MCGDVRRYGGGARPGGEMLLAPSGPKHIYIRVHAMRGCHIRQVHDDAEMLLTIDVPLRDVTEQMGPLELWPGTQAVGA